MQRASHNLQLHHQFLRHERNPCSSNATPDPSWRRYYRRGVPWQSKLYELRGPRSECYQYAEFDGYWHVDADCNFYGQRAERARSSKDMDGTRVRHLWCGHVRFVEDGGRMGEDVQDFRTLWGRGRKHGKKPKPNKSKTGHLCK